MKELKRRGVRILPGGNCGFAWGPVGKNARDLEHSINFFDYTPMEAILSATKLGGEIVMQGGELGQIKPGYLTDLLVVDGNPLVDITILQDAGCFLAIVKDGTFHEAPVQRARTADLPVERPFRHCRGPPSGREAPASRCDE